MKKRSKESTKQPEKKEITVSEERPKLRLKPVKRGGAKKYKTTDNGLFLKCKDEYAEWHIDNFIIGDPEDKTAIKTGTPYNRASINYKYKIKEGEILAPFLIEAPRAKDHLPVSPSGIREKMQKNEGSSVANPTGKYQIVTELPIDAPGGKKYLQIMEEIYINNCIVV